MPLLIYIVVINYKGTLDAEEYLAFEHFAEAAEHARIVLDKDDVISVEFKKVVYI